MAHIYLGSEPGGAPRAGLFGDGAKATRKVADSTAMGDFFVVLWPATALAVLAICHLSLRVGTPSKLRLRRQARGH